MVTDTKSKSAEQTHCSQSNPLWRSRTQIGHLLLPYSDSGKLGQVLNLQSQICAKHFFMPCNQLVAYHDQLLGTKPWFWSLGMCHSFLRLSRIVTC